MSADYGLEHVDTLQDSFLGESPSPAYHHRGRERDGGNGAVHGTPGGDMYANIDHNHGGDISLQSISLLGDVHIKHGYDKGSRAGNTQQTTPLRLQQFPQQKGYHHQNIQQQYTQHKTPIQSGSIHNNHHIGNAYSIALDAKGSPMLIPLLDSITSSNSNNMVNTDHQQDKSSTQRDAPIGLTPLQYWNANYRSTPGSKSPYSSMLPTHRPFIAVTSATTDNANRSSNNLPSSYWRERLSRRSLGSVMTSPSLAKY